MPTLIVPISSVNSYFGFGLQSVGGTAVAPTYFPRFEDGSELGVTTTTEDVWEGDGSRHLSMVIKNGQKVTIKFVSYLRPGEMGFFEKIANGIGSDNYANANLAVSTTLAAQANIGATSFTVNANIPGPFPASGISYLIFEPGTANEEIVPIVWPAAGGAAPFTLSISGTYNGGAGLKIQHANSAVLKSSAPHAFTDQYDGPYFTTEVGLGVLNSQAGEVLRVRDCKVEVIRETGEAGKLLLHEFEITGIASAVQGSVATITRENRQPFIFYNAVFTLNGSTSGDALGIKKFVLERKNNLDDSIQTTHVTPEAIIFSKLEVKVNLDLIMQTMQLFNLMYYGATNGTTDNATIATGSLLVVFTQADNFHTVQYSVATMAYKNVKPPVPKLDGKHYEMSVEAAGTSNQGLNASVVTTTLNNAVYTAY